MVLARKYSYKTGYAINTLKIKKLKNADSENRAYLDRYDLDYDGREYAEDVVTDLVNTAVKVVDTMGTGEEAINTMENKIKSLVEGIEADKVVNLEDIMGDVAKSYITEYEDEKALMDKEMTKYNIEEDSMVKTIGVLKSSGMDLETIAKNLRLPLQLVVYLDSKSEKQSDKIIKLLEKHTNYIKDTYPTLHQLKDALVIVGKFLDSTKMDGDCEALSRVCQIVLHYLEDENLEYERKTKLVEILSNARRNRRIVKNNINAGESIRRCTRLDYGAIEVLYRNIETRIEEEKRPNKAEEFHRKSVGLIGDNKKVVDLYLNLLDCLE